MSAGGVVLAWRVPHRAPAAACVLHLSRAVDCVKTPRYRNFATDFEMLQLTKLQIKQVAFHTRVIMLVLAYSRQIEEPADTISYLASSNALH